MRTSSRRPIATALLLVGAATLFAGCGDEGAHLPASMTASSAAHAGGPTGVDAIDDVIGGDPGAATAGVSTMVDDPVLAGYDGLDTVDGYGIDDPYSRAVADWSETEGAVGGLSTVGLDSGLEDEPLPAGSGGYGGYGSGWDDGLLGSGNGILGTTSWNGAGAFDAGLTDAGLVDDPGLMDVGLDAGIADAGMLDMGFDPSLVDPGIDAGVIDAGLDGGFVDTGMVDTGFVDTGLDAGIADVGLDAGIVF